MHIALKIPDRLSPFRVSIEKYYERDDTFRDIYNDYLTYCKAHQFWIQSRADEAPSRRNEYAELVGEKVNMSIGKTIAKVIGYGEVEKNIRPIFENLRNALKP